MRVGHEWMHIRDQDECKAAKILGSISSTPCPHPLKSSPDARPGRFTGRERGVGRGYSRPDMRVGQVWMHIRDQD
jgi:hypothetical protein